MMRIFLFILIKMTVVSIVPRAGRYYFVSDGRALNVAEVLKTGATVLCDPLFDCLAAASAKRRFYWQWRDIDPATAERDVFWFRLVPARSLSDETSSERFRDKVSLLCRKARTMVFQTPSGTRLVCPCPSGKKKYGNVSLFAMNAPRADKKALLGSLFAEIRREKTPFRVRTHGHDVPWFHVRIEKI
jgi:hypothetical protein